MNPLIKEISVDIGIRDIVGVGRINKIYDKILLYIG